MTTPKEALKTCTECGKEKPHSEFYPHSRARQATAITAYGRKRVMHCGECKVCARARRKSYYTQNRVEILARDTVAAKLRRQRIKDVVFTAYGGWRCACCGETEKQFLSLDHIANDGAEFRRKQFGNRASAGYPTYMWLCKNGFPEGFQVLCMNCQHGKRMNNGVCPHQGTSRDYPSTGVGSSDPKRTASLADEDIVPPAMKVAAVIN